MSHHDPPTELAAGVERLAYQQRLDVFLSSRDAGQMLTRDALRAGITLKRVIDVARDVTAYVDEAITIVRDEYRPSLDCQAGCSYCCCKPGVLTAIPELLRILHHVRSTFDADAISVLRQRARQYASQVAGRDVNALTDESVPCPLLRDGRCSVYEVRPLTCRGYNSTNVDACRRAYENSKNLVPIFSIIKDVTDGATVGVAVQLRDAGGNDSLVDLGTALDIALAADDQFSQDIVEGGEALQPAQNSSWVGELWTRVQETAREVGVKI